MGSKTPKGKYVECIQLTRQFAFCPNAFRVDLYKGCSFGCKYCFANMDWHDRKHKNWKIADFPKIENVFKRALDSDAESVDSLVELVRHRVPIHCGGMSDPFQEREWTHELTYKMIELSNKYNYPILFSTKTDHLPDKYFDILNPKIHAFHISIIGYDDEYIRKWERNTPTARSRLKFAEKLKEKGFWCGIRIQPIIDMLQVEKLCYNLSNSIDYVTLEHIKSMWSVKDATDALLDSYTQQELETMFTTTRCSRIEVIRELRIKNIEKLKEILHNKGIKVGIGDNDLHYLSDSRCCCGMDCINENFDNYLKYNLTYLSTGKAEKNIFIPKTNIRKNINDPKYGLKIDAKEYVDNYIKDHLEWCGENKAQVENYIWGVHRKKLF